MGGFAVVVDWERPIDPGLVVEMMEPIGHRCTGGAVTWIDDHVALAEGRTTLEAASGPFEVATLGPLSLVGDIRFFDRQRLRAVAGPDATDENDDRMLILAAWRRRGPGATLDALDGEFAFVVIDRREHRVSAVRDHLGVRPLFHEIDRGRFRAATELKQLSTTSARPPTADTRSIAEYLDLDFRAEGTTFLGSFHKVPAAKVLTVEAGADLRTARYWVATPRGTRHDPSDVPHRFREQLVASVERRLTGHGASASQLSGGIDSSAIAASVAATGHRGPADHVTISAVFDMASIDESGWVDDTVALLPFAHARFVPEVGPVSGLDDDMRAADSPYVNPIRDLVHGIATAARDHGATILLTGEGGDYVLDQRHHLADIARSAGVMRLLADARAASAFTGRSLPGTLEDPMRMVAPSWVRRAKRAVTSGGRPHRSNLLRRGTGDRSHPRPVARSGPEAIAQDVHAPLVAILNELQDALFSRHDLEVSHPFFDRQVVEFVVDLDARDLPFDGRSKTLARQAFSDDLPRSVLDRNRKTIFNEYLEVGLAANHREYRERFPDVPEPALPIFDDDTYRHRIDAFDQGHLDASDLFELMRAWHVMAWLESSDITASG